jgi:UDP-N-acetyl-2-amino-2-deoxyglucuronate dehydrogenase
MDGREIGFGVVGLGMGVCHCDAVAAAAGARLVAVCDLDPERLKPVAEKHGVRAYDSYAEMLRDPGVEAVCVATPSGMHADMAMAAAAAGKHMLVEKPVDVRLDQIRRLTAAVATAGVKAAVVFQTRTMPMFRRIKAAVDEGRLGRLVGVHAVLPWYREASYYQGPHGSWKGTWAMDGGGSLMNQGVHTVDLLQWVGGRVRSVFGAFGVFAHEIEAEDKAVAVLKFANGALGTLSTTTAAYPGTGRFFLVHGATGTIAEVNDYLQTWKLQGDKDGLEEREMLSFYGARDRQADVKTDASDPLAVGATGHVFHIEDLVQAIRTNRDPYITVPSAAHAVEIVNAIYESGRTGREITIS